MDDEDGERGTLSGRGNTDPIISHSLTVTHASGSVFYKLVGFTNSEVVCRMIIYSHYTHGTNSSLGE